MCMFMRLMWVLVRMMRLMLVIMRVMLVRVVRVGVVLVRVFVMIVFLLMLVAMRIVIVMRVIGVFRRNHVDLGRGDSTTHDFTRFKARAHVQRGRRFSQHVKGDAGVDQRAQQHVAADSRKALEITNPHRFVILNCRRDKKGNAALSAAARTALASTASAFSATVWLFGLGVFWGLAAPPRLRRFLA